MQKIYWATKEIDEKYAVMILAPTESGICFCLSESNGWVYQSFETMKELLLYVNELNKPKYYEMFGTSYELIEISYKTDEWESYHLAWNKTNELFDYVIEQVTMPFYYRWYKKIKDLIIKPNPLI